MIKYQTQTASKEEIYQHLLQCDIFFIPSLSSRVNIKNFSKKIFEQTVTFEAWENSTLIALLSVYCNDNEKKIAFINNLSVNESYRHKKIASSLMKNCILHVKKIFFEKIELEVGIDNKIALSFYTKFNFKKVEKSHNSSIILRREI